MTCCREEEDLFIADSLTRWSGAPGEILGSLVSSTFPAPREDFYLSETEGVLGYPTANPERSVSSPTQRFPQVPHGSIFLCPLNALRRWDEGSFLTKADVLTISFTEGRDLAWADHSICEDCVTSLLSFLSPVALSKTFQENSHLTVKSQTQTHQEVIFFSLR